jgi:hypothetical protein
VTEPAESSSLCRRDLVFALGFALLSVVLYWPTLGFGYIDYDERLILLSRPELFNQETLAASLRAILFGAVPREEPLIVRDLTWTLDSRLFGFGNAFGYHLGNVVLHGLNSALIYILGRFWSDTRAAGVIAASWFVIHPIHLEPVCWVMGRKDVLVAFFMLSTILTDRWATLGLRFSARRIWGTLASLVLLVLALGSKASAYTGVLVLIGQQYWLPQRRSTERFRYILLRLSPHVLATVVFVAWYQRQLSQYGVLGGRGPSPVSWIHAKTLFRMLPVALFENVKLLVYPFDYSIAYDYPHVYRPISFIEWAVGLGVTMGLLALMFRWRRTHPGRALSLWAAGMTIVPYLNIAYIGIWTANRYLYLVSFFVALPFFDLGVESWRHGVRSVRLGLIAGYSTLMVTLLAWCLMIQPSWNDAESFWSYENKRTSPTLLAKQALAKMYVTRAEASGNEQVRSEMVALADEIIVPELSRSHSLPPFLASYFTTDRTDLSGLYNLKGRVAALRGEPYPAQIQYHLEAYRLKPGDPRHTFALSRIYFDWAVATPDEQQRGLAEKSLEFFREQLLYTRRDPKWLARDLRRLDEGYGVMFPFLSERIQEIHAEVLGSEARP